MRNARLVMTQYRRHILDIKRRWSPQAFGTRDNPIKRRAQRGFMYYKEFLKSYFIAKRAVINNEEFCDA